MKISNYHCARALLYLSLFINQAAGGMVRHSRRDESDTPTTVEPSLTPIDSEQGSTISPTLSATGTISSRSSIATTTASHMTSSATTATAAVQTTLGGVNSTLFNTTTIPLGQLPLEAVITPGWAVAGVILLSAGVVYALVGIKTKWLHTFFSSAFLASLGTTVLIVYVMTPPVSNAIQGAYVVGVVCTGLIMGGLAIIFKEITECLGCLLGGFCLSMWLLTLRPGGLIEPTGGKVAFVAAIALTAFGLYFTRWTRTYGLIACNCFSGATAAVLGIDCFSRAGYKEFWAYIWALNDNLFPLGTSTYPLTRGIRVELAVTILIFLAGIVSQLKLWRIIKDRRDRRNAELAVHERGLRVEEEKVGREVEESTSRERRVWERVHGDGAVSPLGGSGDSGVGDMESEKRLRHSQNSNGLAVPVLMQLESPVELDGESGFAEYLTRRASTILSFSKPIAAERVISRHDSDGRVTVMVARDDAPSEPTAESSVTQDVEAGYLDGGRLVSTPTAAQDQRRGSHPTNLSPIVVPLPFSVRPVRDEADRSSAATFADEEEDEQAQSKIQARDRLGDGLVRKLPNGSVKLFRSLSQRSACSQKDHNGTAGKSSEGLLEPAQGIREETDSIVVNMDDTSSNDCATSPGDEKCARDIGVGAKSDVKPEGDGKKNPAAEWISSPLATWLGEAAGRSGIAKEETVAAGASSSVGQDIKSEVDTKFRELDAACLEEMSSGQAWEEQPHHRRRVSAASIDSVPASLKGNLLPALSRVAMSYRTNEWAKHLSGAETPKPDTLQIPDFAEEASETPTLNEEPAPLNVEQLQQTAENAAPPPAAPRSGSALSNCMSPLHAISRTSSWASLSGYPEISSFPASPNPEPLNRNRGGIPYRSMSGTLRAGASRLFAEPIAEEGDGEPSQHAPMPVYEEGDNSTAHEPTPRELSSSASAPNLLIWPAQLPAANSYQTLIGMREQLLRSKVSFQGPFGPPGPDMPSDSGNVYKYPLHQPAVGSSSSNSPVPTVDYDDIPLSQRRVMMRQSSLNLAHKGRSRHSLTQKGVTADATMFNSHQPSRHGHAAPEAVRRAQLANFRNSVAADLRSASPTDIQSPLSPQLGHHPSLTDRHTSLLASASMGSLRGAYGRDSNNINAGYSTPIIQRSIELQRNYMLGQKEAEAQRKETERLEYERGQREFKERMRNGSLLEAHQHAMRRLQGGARPI